MVYWYIYTHLKHKLWKMVTRKHRFSSPTYVTFVNSLFSRSLLIPINRDNLADLFHYRVLLRLQNSRKINVKRTIGLV